MASRIVLESDLSGEPDAVTETVGLDREWHQVDLTEAEREDLRQFLAPYLDAGRRIGSTLDGHKKKVVPDTTVEEREQIRTWAKANGYEVAPYGRIPKKVFRAYRAAHPNSTV